MKKIFAVATALVVLVVGCGASGRDSQRALPGLGTPRPQPAPAPEGAPVVRGGPGEEVAVGVDFAKKIGPVRWVGIGFLSSVDVGNAPGEDKIAPLRPRFWRDWRFWINGQVGTDLYRRLARLAPVVQFDMANSWLDSQKSMPCQNWNAWSAHVSRIARDFKRNGINLEWLVWGEPDNGSFFGKDKCKPKDYLKLYELAFRAIRSEFPNAVVGGPGLANANPNGWPNAKRGIVMLLDHCLAAGCEINFVSWHEYVDENVAAVSDHIGEVRRVLSDPKYARLDVRKIYIGEVVGGAAMYSPGHAVAMFAELEYGGADGAAKACWPVPGPGECDYNTLDGLLTQNSQPRSVWWAFRAYAAQAGQWVETKSSNPAIAALASVADGSGRMQILVGHSGFVPSSNRVKRVSFKFSNVGPGSFQAKFARIPNTEKQPLAKPEQVGARRVSAPAGTITFTLPEFRPNDAYYIILEPEGGRSK